MRILRLTEEERRDWLRLSFTENVGPRTFGRLTARYGTASVALAAIPELARCGGLGRPLRLCPADRVDQVLASASECGVEAIAACEPDYPALLREIESFPPVLFAKGRTVLANTPAVAVVGARNASAAGRKLARQLASDFGEAKLTVVSGLARGIDTAAHEASLASGTVAVLAGGIDQIYPPENEELHRQIADQGLLISEMPPGTVPKAEHFPRRNRIISGLSMAAVVVEAALRSGSLITARYAAEQGREVFCVPGSPLDPRSEGCNRLIRDGATLLMSSSDVIGGVETFKPRPDSGMAEPEEYPHDTSGPPERHRDTIFALLSPAPVDTDTLIRESGLSAPVVASLLLELELAGKAARLPHGLVSIAHPASV